MQVYRTKSLKSWLLAIVCCLLIIFFESNAEAETVFQQGEEVELIKEEVLLFNSTEFRRGVTGERFTVAAHRASEQRLYVLVRDKSNRVIAVNFPDSSAIKVLPELAAVAESGFIALEQGKLAEAKSNLNRLLVDPRMWQMCKTILTRIEEIEKKWAEYPSVQKIKVKTEKEIYQKKKNAETLRNSPNILTKGDMSHLARASSIEREALALERSLEGSLEAFRGSLRERIRELAGVSEQLRETKAPMEANCVLKGAQFLDKEMGRALKPLRSNGSEMSQDFLSSLSGGGREGQDSTRDAIQSARAALGERRMYNAVGEIASGLKKDQGSLILNRLNEEISFKIDQIEKRLKEVEERKSQKDFQKALMILREMRTACSDSLKINEADREVSKIVSEKDSLFEAANGLEGVGDYERAIEIYEKYGASDKVLKLLPMFAKQREEKGDFLGAKVAYERAKLSELAVYLTDKAKLQLSEYDRAKVLAREGDFDEAVKIYGKYSDDRRINQVNFEKKVIEWNSKSQMSMFSGWSLCMIKPSGALFSAGIGAYVGDGVEGDLKKWRVCELQPGEKWQSVCVGVFHGVALRIDGTIWGWGSNDMGQIGDGSQVDRLKPVQIGSDKDWKFISCFGACSVGIKEDGSLWGWGPNDWIYGNRIDSKQANSPTLMSGDNDWRMAKMDREKILGLKKDGTMLAWGDPGKFGPGVDASNPIRIGEKGEWLSISNSGDLIIKRDGSVWFVEIGEGNKGPGRYELKKITSSGRWVKIEGDEYFWIGVQEDGSMWTWGENQGGQVGDGTLERAAVPVRVKAATWTAFCASRNWSSLFQKGLTHVYEVSAVQGDLSLWNWGCFVKIPTRLSIFDSNSSRVDAQGLTSSDSAGVLMSEGDAEGEAARKILNWVDSFTKKYGHRPEAKGGVYNLEKEAEAGVLEGQHLLGRLLYEVSVKNKDARAAAKGMHWLEKAAEQGHSLSQLYLGLAYINGLSGEKNLNEGVAWLRKAAAQGLERASSELSKLKKIDLREASPNAGNQQMRSQEARGLDSNLSESEARYVAEEERKWRNGGRDRMIRKTIEETRSNPNLSSMPEESIIKLVDDSYKRSREMMFRMGVSQFRKEYGDSPEP